MAAPHLYLDSRDIKTIRENLGQFGWYRQAFERLKANCDQMLQKGFSVPDTCGFVFYNSCKSDNTPLIFNPYDAENHVCPTCGMNYQDPPFHRAWQCYYHQWLSQMSIQLGLVYAVTGDPAYAAAVRQMLLDYVRKYPGYENNDNELGATKVFQSTYIESIWLSYLACGYDLTNGDPCYSQADRNAIVKDLFLASAAVIRDYDEKWNNRQAFNNSGMCAAALLAEDEELLQYVLRGEHGFIAHMERSVLCDGLWYEGDNYHFATVPSMVNIAEMCLHNGIDLYHTSFGGHSLEDMFLAPLKSLQPDGTFPSRKDSAYGSQIAQRWYSGLYELAHARYDNEAFGRILKVMYGRSLPEDEDYINAAGLMDIFRSVPASRSDLDWRGFMTMTPDLGKRDGVPVTRSVNMQGTGLAVLRQQEGRHYLSLDYGDYGGGHGHPDRLAVTWFANGRRWLCDYGTGQYYFDHLNWYRSTIGHNTLGVDGKQHEMVNGRCSIFGETPECSAARGEISGLAPGVNAARTVVLLSNGLFLDCYQAESDKPHTYRNTYHSFGSLRLPKPAEPVQLEGEAYRFLQDTCGYQTEEDGCIAFETEEATLLLRTLGGEPTGVYGAKAYGSPREIPRQFPLCILEKKGCRAGFLHLLEDVPANEESCVRGFFQTEEGCGILTASGEEYRIGFQHGVTVCKYQDGQLVSFSAFGCRKVPGVLETKLAPESICGQKGPEGWMLQAEGHYGQLTLLDGLQGAPVFCGGAKVPETGELMEGFLLEKPLDTRLVEGIVNQIQVELGNYTQKETEIVLNRETAPFPYGLELESSQSVSLKPGESQIVSLRLVPGGKTDKESRWEFEPCEALALSESPAYGRHQALVRVHAENQTQLPLETAFSFGETAVLAPGAGMDFWLDEEAVQVSGQWAELEYTAVLTQSGKVFRRKWKKALLEPEWKERAVPLNGPDFAPDFRMEDASFTARNEHRWQGEADLSAQGMLFVSGGTSLTLRLRVRDDCVQFSGGKFPYDNDSVQLCFSRPDGDGTNAVSRVMLMGSVSDEACVVRPVENIRHPEEISLSIQKTEDGYELLADIPFHCLGGAPEQGEVWGFDLLVNDRDSGVRRDLQLIWSGALPGERLYLREDHHDASRFGMIRF